MKTRTFGGCMLFGIFVSLCSAGGSADIPGSVSYRLWFEDKYSSQKMFVCLSGLVQYDGSVVVRSTTLDDVKVISWRLSVDDLKMVHDVVNQASFLALTNKADMQGVAVLDPGYVRIDVKEDNLYHSVTRLYDDSEDEGMTKFKRVMLAILNLIPNIEGEFLPHQDLSADLAKDQLLSQKAAKSASQGMYLVVSSNVVQAAWSFNGGKKQVIVNHDSSHDGLGMGQLR